MSTVGPVIEQESEALAKQSTDIVQQITALTKVVSNEGYEAVCNIRRAATSMRREMWDWWTTNKVDPAHKLHKQLVSDRSQMVNPVDAAIARCDSLTLPWEQEQERIRLQREAEAAAEAKRKADADALEAAAQLEKMGDAETAEMVLEEAIQAPSPMVSVPSSLPRIQGRSSREIWTFEITDEKLIPRDYLMVDTVKIGGVVRAMRGTTNIPGVKAKPQNSVTQRR